MEERSLRVLPAETTFFNKISNTLTKLLVPTKIGINSMMISIKRNSLLKAYTAYVGAQDSEKKDNSPIKNTDNKGNSNNNYSDDSIEETTQYDINIYKSGDVTRNCKVPIEEKSKKKIELQDLISFLENNDKTPLQRLILQRAYIKMTSPFIKNNVNK